MGWNVSIFLRCLYTSFRDDFLQILLAILIALQ